MTMVTTAVTTKYFLIFSPRSAKLRINLDNKIKWSWLYKICFVFWEKTKKMHLCHRLLDMIWLVPLGSGAVHGLWFSPASASPFYHGRGRSCPGSILDIKLWGWAGVNVIEKLPDYIKLGGHGGWKMLAMLSETEGIRDKCWKAFFNQIVSNIALKEC